MSARRRAADHSSTRRRHFDDINDLIEGPSRIVAEVSIDETSTADNSVKEKMKAHAVSGHIAMKGGKPYFNEVELKDKFTLLTGVGIRCTTDTTGIETITPIDNVPSLNVHKGTDTINLPTNENGVLPNSVHIAQENGSITATEFGEYLELDFIPWAKNEFPDLDPGSRELLLVYDAPSVHNVDDRIMELCLDAGIILYYLPKNSTHWSQVCDHRMIFGAFKQSYYRLLEDFCNDPRNIPPGKATVPPLGAAQLLPLIRQAWEAVTPKRITESFFLCGLWLGTSEENCRKRREGQALVIKAAPNLANTILKNTFIDSEKSYGVFRTPPQATARTFLHIYEISTDGKHSTKSNKDNEGLTCKIQGRSNTREGIALGKLQREEREKKAKKTAERKEETLVRRKIFFVDGFKKVGPRALHAVDQSDLAELDKELKRTEIRVSVERKVVYAEEQRLRWFQDTPKCNRENKKTYANLSLWHEEFAEALSKRINLPVPSMQEFTTSQPRSGIAC